jgi:hypothetical protein
MSMTKRVTGPGVTERVNMVSADLGVVRFDPMRNAYAYLFGDNFAERYMKGEWQSPSIVMYDADHNLLGIPVGTNQIVPSGNRRQAIPYVHHQDNISTILPCDFILIDGLWSMAAMVVGLGGLGNELRTVFWQSRDLVNWHKTDPYVSFGHPGHPGNVMLTFDELGDFVYIYGTGGLARDRGIWLWRCDSSTFPHGLWEPWGMDHVGWGWGIPNERTPLLGGRYGELCFRVIQGQCVLSFFDADRYCCSAMTAVAPGAFRPNSNRVDYAHGHQFNQLYGGYITDDSRLSEPGGMKFIVSQWNTQNNDPYHVIAFADTLDAAGPLVEPEPEPEPEPTPEPVPPTPPIGDQMTPQELYELLMRELAASGSEPITTPEGEKLTLRQAVEQIYWKERGPHTLVGRPRHPKDSDDQLGHVLSTRAEVEYTQACVVAMADSMGIDTAKLYEQVKRSLGK